MTPAKSGAQPILRYVRFDKIERTCARALSCIRRMHEGAFRRRPALTREPNWPHPARQHTASVALRVAVGTEEVVHQGGCCWWGHARGTSAHSTRGRWESRPAVRDDARASTGGGPTPTRSALGGIELYQGRVEGGRALLERQLQGEAILHGGLNGRAARAPPHLAAVVHAAAPTRRLAVERPIEGSAWRTSVWSTPSVPLRMIR